MSGLRRRALLQKLLTGTATTLSGSSPLLLPNAMSRSITNLVQTGKCIQLVTPTGESTPIYCNNGYITNDNNNDPITVGNKNKIIITGKNISSFGSITFTGTGQGVKVWEGYFVSDLDVLAKPNIRYTISVDAVSTDIVRSENGALLVFYVDYSDGTSSTFGINPTSDTQRFTWTTAANKTVTNIRDWVKTARWTSGTINVSNMQIEIGTTASDRVPYKVPQSITNSTDLFSAGTYADTLNILTGSLTRNVRVRILDGTEDSWYQSMSNETYRYRMKLDDGLYKSGRDTSLICSHFAPAATGSPVNSCFLNGSSNNEYLFCVPNQKITLLADWKDFLHDELEAGRPVIIIYPLATPTTESSTAQTLSTFTGQNTLISASDYIDEIALSATYYANT